MWDVLVCEDFTNLREALVDFLEESGRWTVRAVADGQGLRQQLVNRLPDVLLLDVGLPHESGVDIAGWLRATHPDVGIVLLSGRGAPPDRLAGWRAGADAYLIKPAEMEEVELVLRSVAQRVRASAPPSAPHSRASCAARIMSRSPSSAMARPTRAHSTKRSISRRSGRCPPSS